MGTVSGEQFKTVKTVDIVMGGEGLFDGQAHEEGGSRDDSRDRDEERKARNRAALKKFRDKEEKEKEEKARRMEQLRRENQEIEQRTAVHQQELSFLRQVVTAHVQENGNGILEAEPVLKSFLEEDQDQNSG